MPVKFIRRSIPVGGMSTATPADQLDNSQSPNLINVRFRFNEIRPAPGRAALAGPVASPIQEIARFSVDDTTKWTVMLTDQFLYKLGDTYPGSPPSWYQVPGVALTGTGRWSWCTGEDCFFFARKNGGGIYRWKGGTTSVDKVPNCPATDVRFVEYYNNRLLAANVAEAGKSWANRVRYPVNGNHENWTADGSGFIDLYEPEQEPIQGLKVLSNRCAVYREHSIVDLVASGTIAQVFNKDQRTSGVGTVFPATLDSNGTMHFFMGNDGNIWAWNGSQLQSIGDSLYKNFEQQVDLRAGDYYFGKVYPFMNEYWLWIGTSNVYIFDFLQGRWLQDDFANLAAVGDAELAQSQNTWAEYTNSWASYGALMWRELRAKSNSRLICGLSDNSTIVVARDIVGRQDGSVIDAFVETKDYYANESNNPIGVSDPIGPMVQRTIEQLLLIYEYNNDQDFFELGVSTDHGKSWVVQNVYPNKVGYGIANWKVTGNVARFRIRQSSTKPVFRWQGLVEANVPGGPYLALEQPISVQP